MRTSGNLRFLAWGLGFWLTFMVAATLDGIVREAFLVPAIGYGPAHVASGIFVLMAIYVGTWVLISRIGAPRHDAMLWVLGFCWGALTVGFELLIVVVARGEPASVLWADYHPANLLRGNLILPGLVLMLLAPPLVKRLRR
jgi:hypothetical protein